MIRGLHAMFYSSDPVATRAFARDVLGFAATDVGDGWLIFAMPDADMGVHPASPPHGMAGTHNISFYCDDIAGTVADLAAKGAQFSGPVRDEGFGLVMHFAFPGVGEIQLYQPHYGKG